MYINTYKYPLPRIPPRMERSKASTSSVFLPFRNSIRYPSPADTVFAADSSPPSSRSKGVGWGEGQQVTSSSLYTPSYSWLFRGM